MAKRRRYYGNDEMGRISDRRYDNSSPYGREGYRYGSQDNPYNNSGFYDNPNRSNNSSRYANEGRNSDRYYSNNEMERMNGNRIDNMSRYDNEGYRYVGPGNAARGIEGSQANPNSKIPPEQVGVAQYRYGEGRDGRQLINNDRTKIANMPTEMMLKYYPENPSYFPDTEIDDSMRGIDQKGRRAYLNPNYIYGRID